MWLVTAIIENSDAEALNELHEYRTPFSYGKLRHLRLSEFLLTLKEKAPIKEEEFKEHGYNLALSKFLDFPSNDSQTDCRKYFKVALDALHKRSWSSELEAEKRLGQILQYLASKHFEYALKEARRSIGHFSRYKWELSDGSITVMMPKTLVGAERREWLKSYFPHIEKVSASLKHIVQSKIDEAFDHLAVHLDSYEGERLADTHIKMPWDYMDDLGINDLAIAVSEEKADTITSQRQAIQELGADQLKNLILRIFDAVAHNESTDGKIAHEFGLSKATFSRFAGRKWTQIPDLWKNTASILAHHPTLKDLITS